MAVNTKIQWCDDTVNPTMGCDGCELWRHFSGNGGKLARKCYAGKLTQRFGPTNRGLADSFDQVSEAPGRMLPSARRRPLQGVDRPTKPWLNGLPRLIFLSDMADALSKAITFDYLSSEVIDNVASEQGQQHHWLWLTKQPHRMAKFSAWLSDREICWPRNLWPGTSITTQATTSRIKHLLRVGNNSTLRFLSVEPQWEAIDLTRYLPSIDWVIQGGESGSGAEPFDLAWAYDLLRQCRRHRVPYFLKQLGARPVHRGKPLSLRDGHGGDWSEWPAGLRVRRMPIRRRRRGPGGCAA